MKGPLSGPLDPRSAMTRPGLEPGTYGLKDRGHIQTDADTVAQPQSYVRGSYTEAAPKPAFFGAREGHSGATRALAWWERNAVVAWVFLVLGFAVGTLNARTETRREVRQCLAAKTDENVQFACPAWLRRLL